MLNLNRYMRCTLTRFRFGVSDIKVHRSRFKFYNVDELKCPLCLSAVENEVPFVLCCPALEDLRYEFTESKYFNNPCEFRLALLLASQNERALKNLALFLYKAFSRNPAIVKNLNVHHELIFKNVIIISFAYTSAPALCICYIPTSVICLLSLCVL